MFAERFTVASVWVWGITLMHSGEQFLEGLPVVSTMVLTYVPAWNPQQAAVRGVQCGEARYRLGKRARVCSCGLQAEPVLVTRGTQPPKCASSRVEPSVPLLVHDPGTLEGQGRTVAELSPAWAA